MLHYVASGRSLHFLQRAERPKVGNTALYIALGQYPKSTHKYTITQLAIKPQRIKYYSVLRLTLLDNDGSVGIVDSVDGVDGVLQSRINLGDKNASLKHDAAHGAGEVS